MKKTVLKNYARLLARMGINVQRGQEVFIYAELDQPEFVRTLTEECYRAGASRVFVEWGDSAITRLHIKHRSQAVLSELTSFEKDKWEYQAEKLPCKLYLMSEDPDALAGIDQKKYATAQQAKMKVIKPLRDQMENRYQWCIAAVPGEKWAKKIFPELSRSAAVEKLWEAILSTSRATEDPIAAWEQHNDDLAARCKTLNDLGIRELHYTASNGTDLRVSLMDESIFMAGGEETLNHVFFNPNIPSEEVFTSPKRGAAEGIVYASRPLSYNGQLIENFSVRFEGGRAIEVHAEKNESLLREMIGMDEGAAYLGECALVPYDSPIRQSEILFYNTLFDENAACHLALGRGFNNCVRDYEKYTNEEIKALGVNDSIIHEDFMIGTKDLSIVATTRDGKEVQIFRDGNWAI
jgi:aminopeptidase